jgi:hypothetical protein
MWGTAAVKYEGNVSMDHACGQIADGRTPHGVPTAVAHSDACNI